MTAPVIRQYVGTIPSKGQSQVAFDTNVDAFLVWQATQFGPDMVAFGSWADAVRASLIAGNLPPLTGRALDAVRVNAGATSVEFADVTAAGWAVLDDADATAQRATLGLVIGTDVSSITPSVTAVALADAAATLTAAQLVVSRLFTITPTVARTLTTPTAALIIAAMPGAPVGASVPFTIVNLAAFDVTLAAGAGVTLSGRMVINGGSGIWRAVITGAATVTIYNEAGLNLNAPGTAPIFACRAWVNFNGTGTIAIRASGNVSSLTDNGVGDYTVNFTTALPDADYAVMFGTNTSGVSANNRGINIRSAADDTAPTTKTVSALRIVSGSTSSNNLTDMEQINLAIFR